MLPLVDSDGALCIIFADGNRRVPNVNRNSDDKFKFNLGYFANDWNDNNCLLLFCYLFVSPVGSFL